MDGLCKLTIDPRFHQRHVWRNPTYDERHNPLSLYSQCDLCQQHREQEAHGSNHVDDCAELGEFN